MLPNGEVDVIRHTIALVEKILQFRDSRSRFMH
jgi:hypothetical protein